MNTKVDIWCGGWSVAGSTEVNLFKRGGEGIEALWEKVVEAFGASSVETSLFVTLTVGTRKSPDADFTLRDVRDWESPDYYDKLSLGRVYTIEDEYGNTIGEIPICHEGIIGTFGVDSISTLYITLPEHASILREGGPRE